MWSSNQSVGVRAGATQMESLQLQLGPMAMCSGMGMGMGMMFGAQQQQPQPLLYLQPRPPNLSFCSSPKSSTNTAKFPSRFRFPSTTVPLPSLSSKRMLSFLGFGAGSASNFEDNIGDSLGEVTIYTASGEPVLFKDLWDQKEGMAVVALLRHFGCPCCWELAATLKESKSKFDSAGVKLIAVGVGTPDKARLLAERLPFPMDCLYSDPDRKAYDLLGLYYGVGRTFFNPASAKVFLRFGELLRAVQNYTVKATPDDTSGVLQQGGMFVFKGTQLLYARKDEGTGDHAPLDDVFEVCCKVPVA